MASDTGCRVSGGLCKCAVDECAVPPAPTVTSGGAWRVPNQDESAAIARLTDRLTVLRGEKPDDR